MLDGDGDGVAGDGGMEGAAAAAEKAAKAAAAAAVLKEAENAYVHLATTGTFADGVMPEVAPRWEWIRWDL